MRPHGLIAAFLQAFLFALLAAPSAAEVVVKRLSDAEAAQYLAGRAETKSERPAARLLLPYFQIDTTDPEGETTFFAVRNESLSDVSILVHYYASDRPHEPQESIPYTLSSQQVRTFDVRSVPDLVVDDDGVATGYAVIETVDGGAVLQGDTFQLNPGQAFATGGALVDIDPSSEHNDLCSVFAARFLNGGGFDGGTLLNIWLDVDVQPNPAEPILFYTVYNQAGERRFVSQLSADQAAFQVPVSQLTAPIPTNFGVVEIEFADTVGHVSLTMSALDLYSVGIEATCID